MHGVNHGCSDATMLKRVLLYEVCRHECVIGYMLLYVACILLLHCPCMLDYMCLCVCCLRVCWCIIYVYDCVLSTYIGMVDVIMHEVLVCIVI